MYNLDNALNLILNLEIKKFTRDCLDNAPKYFWRIPSSSTGKYHPDNENCEGGEVLHTKKGVKIAEDLCRNFDVVGNDRDCVISASIMHDICKNGIPNDEGHTVNGHGSLWIRVVEKAVSRKELIENKHIKTIGRLIGCHMGRWDEPYIVANDKMMICVQIADYISSRKYVDVKV